MRRVYPIKEMNRQFKNEDVFTILNDYNEVTKNENISAKLKKYMKKMYIEVCKQIRKHYGHNKYISLATLKEDKIQKEEDKDFIMMIVFDHEVDNENYKTYNIQFDEEGQPYIEIEE